MKPLPREQLVTLVAAVGICTIMELEKLVQPNSSIAGQIQRIHESITKVANHAGIKLEGNEWIEVGIVASNAAMKTINKAVQAAEPKKPRSTKKAIA